MEINENYSIQILNCMLIQKYLIINQLFKIECFF